MKLCWEREQLFFYLFTPTKMCTGPQSTHTRAHVVRAALYMTACDVTHLIRAHRHPSHHAHVHLTHVTRVSAVHHHGAIWRGWALLRKRLLWIRTAHKTQTLITTTQIQSTEFQEKKIVLHSSYCVLPDCSWVVLLNSSNLKVKLHPERR